MDSLDISRASHTCLRCRRRKKKCDRGTPRCSHCRKANAVCSRDTIVKGSQVVVCTVAGLEAEVARLEAEVAASSQKNTDREPATPVVTFDGSPSHGSALGAQAPAPGLAVLADLNNATVYDYESYNLGRMLRRALARGNDTLDVCPEKTIRRPLVELATPDGLEPTHGIPTELLDLYLERYFENVNPTFPILDVARASSNLKLILSGHPVDSCEAGLVYLALALGASFPGTDSLLDARAASQLWLAASRVVLADDESESTVGMLILMALFSLLEDGCGSAWHLVELAVRSCIALGLHSKATEDAAHLAPLFWSAYLLDRWVSCSLGLPVSLPDGEFDQEIPSPGSLPESNHHPDPTILWRMAYHIDDDGFETPVTSIPLSANSGRSRHPLHDMIAWDLGIAHATRCIIRDGPVAAQNFDEVASRHLSTVEMALRGGVRIPWTTGYAVFTAVMVQLTSFGHPPKYRVLSRRQVPDSAHILDAVDTMQSIGRRFPSLKSLGELLDQLQQQSSITAATPSEITIPMPRHSGLYNITDWALKSIGIT